MRLDTEQWGSRWYPGAGIYRNVWLVKTAPVHVGHWGVYVTTPEITDDVGDVKLAVTVDNQADRSRQGQSSAPTFMNSAPTVAGQQGRRPPPSRSWTARPAASADHYAADDRAQPEALGPRRRPTAIWPAR